MWAGRRLWQKELKRKNMLLLYIFLTLLIMAWFGCGPNTRQIRSCIFWQSFESLWSFLESFRVLLACCNSIQNAGYTPIPLPKRNTFSLGLNIGNEEIDLSEKLKWTNTLKMNLLYRYSHWGLFFVFLVQIDASPVICGRPVGHPCTTFPSLGQTGICAMRPPRPAYGICPL